MLKKEVLAALNKQIQHELTASYVYTGLAVWFESQVLKGFAAWFTKQAEEERAHAKKFLAYVQDRGGEVVLGALPAPKTQFKNFVEALKTAQAFERGTTESINDLYAVAAKAGDLATQEMLQWFIKEQVEEEQWTDEFVTMGEKIGESVGSLYMLDHRIGKKE